MTSGRNKLAKASAYRLPKDVAFLRRCKQVRAVIIDHSTGTDSQTFEIAVWGLLVHYDRDMAVIIGWLPIEEDSDSISRNWEVYSLVTSAIKELTVLKDSGKIKLKR